MMCELRAKFSSEKNNVDNLGMKLESDSCSSLLIGLGVMMKVA